MLVEGTHKQIETTGKQFSQTIEVGKNFYKGSFEVALWGKKVDKKDCTIENCYWCKKNGFHLDELLDYKTGYFNH